MCVRVCWEGGLIGCEEGGGGGGVEEAIHPLEISVMLSMR